MSEQARNQDPIAEIEELVARIEAVPDEAVKAPARELVAGILALHKKGLVKILESIRKGQSGGERVIAALAEDAAVSSLLVLHDLHPQDLEARVAEAVERLQNPYPDLSLESLEEGRLRVRIGARGGNPAAAARAVEASLLEAVPDLTSVTVAVAADPPLVTIRRKEAAP